MVYLPTNGGMLHGFDGETGDEIVRLHSRRRHGARPGRGRGKPGPPLGIRGAGGGGEQRNPEPSVHDVRSAHGQGRLSPLRCRRRQRVAYRSSRSDAGRGGRALSGLDITDPAGSPPPVQYRESGRVERRASRRNGRDLVDSGHGQRPDHESHLEPRSNRSVARLLRRRLRLQQRRERRPVPLRGARRERLRLSPCSGDERYDGGHPEQRRGDDADPLQPAPAGRRRQQGLHHESLRGRCPGGDLEAGHDEPEPDQLDVPEVRRDGKEPAHHRSDRVDERPKQSAGLRDGGNRRRPARLHRGHRLQGLATLYRRGSGWREYDAVRARVDPLLVQGVESGRAGVHLSGHRRHRGRLDTPGVLRRVGARVQYPDLHRVLQ